MYIMALEIAKGDGGKLWGGSAGWTRSQENRGYSISNFEEWTKFDWNQTMDVETDLLGSEIVTVEKEYIPAHGGDRFARLYIKGDYTVPDFNQRFVKM